MRILVCVKQVPDTGEIRIDPQRGTLIREGVPAIVNPYDAYALELAVRMAETAGDSQVTVLCMGPKQAETALRHCLAVGAAQGYLISDKAYAGSDTLATSNILSRAVEYLAEKEGAFDLILCGKQAIDGDTAQVGPQLAEHLAVPQITCVTQAEVADGVVRATQDTEDGYQRWECPLPCLLTVTKPPFEPRFPSIKGKLAAARAEIHHLSQQELQADPGSIGLAGSATRVSGTAIPQGRGSCCMIQEQDSHATARKLWELLGKDGVPAGGDGL